jgi:glycosyltransferase involved in cell wall biosynthesis
MPLDIVIPAHNEERRIAGMLAAYRAVCAAPDIRFIVALDGCSDSTRDIVEHQGQVDPRVVSRDYPKLGKGGVIMESFRASDADLVAFADADCATPPAELLRLAEITERTGVDGAIAARWHPSAVLPGHRRRPLRRRTASQLFAIGVRQLFGLPFADTQCGAKVLRRRLVDQVVPLLSSRDFVFDVDLLLTARQLGFHITEVPTVWVDRSGSRVDLGRDGRRMAASLLRLWLHHRVLPVPPADQPPTEATEATEPTEATAPVTTLARPTPSIVTSPPEQPGSRPVESDGYARK